MGTWPIYKKTLFITDQKELSFDKISPDEFYFFLSFQYVLVEPVLGHDPNACNKVIRRIEIHSLLIQ